MGKGDKRTRRGKIFAGSYGKTRQKLSRPSFVPVDKPASASEAVPKERKPKIKKKEAAPDVVQEQPAVETPATETTPEPTAEPAPAAAEEPATDAGAEESAAAAE